MPYAIKDPTLEDILALIKPGQIYVPYELARKFRVHSTVVRKILMELVEQGTLTTIQVHKTICFIIPSGTAALKNAKRKPHIDPATVAQPRTHAVLTGEIVGYDAEINRRQQLCMSIRRVA